MMHSKNNNNKKAFTLIEVLVALLIAATVLVPLLVLQGTTFKGVGYFSQAISRVFHAKSFLVDQHIKMHIQGKVQKQFTKKSTHPDATLTYNNKNVSKKSSLKSVKNLHQETVTAEWETPFGKQQETLVNFIYLTEQKKK